MKISEVRVSTVEMTAERAAVLKARGYLAERSGRAVAGDLGRILAKAGTPVLIPGDELPEGWPERPG